MKRGAIVGFGNMGKLHLEASKGVTDVIAVCDTNKEMTRGVELPVYESFVDLLSSEKLDYVDICLPHTFHSIMILDAMAHHIDAICEKPVAIDLQELKLIDIMLEKFKDTKLIVNHNYMYHPQYAMLKTLIDSGVYGKPLYVDLVMHSRGSYWDIEWRGNPFISGGGIFLDDGIHMSYLSRWLLGANPTSVQASIRNVTFESGHSDDFGDAVFTFDNGSVAHIACTAFKDNNKSLTYRRVECEKATLVLPYHFLSPNVEIYHKGGTDGPELIPIINPKPTNHTIFDTEFISAFSELLKDYTKGNFRNPILFDEAKKDTTMILIAYESSLSGKAEAF